MANTISNPNLYSGIGRFINNSLNPLNNQSSNSSKVAQFQQNESANYNVNISAEGFAALQNQSSSENIDTGIFTQKELSSKAKSLLEKLQDKYGDYNFIVSDDMENPQALVANSEKKYSVILTSDELEKMANDDDYANQMMGKVEDAAKTADSIIEKAAAEGVQVNQVSISFDDNGNTKLFATLEKLSESQQKRLDVAKEKSAEESKDDQSTQISRNDEEEQTPIISIVADTEESFLEQLKLIDWDEVFRNNVAANALE